jgi:hypothetical protein
MGMFSFCFPKTSIFRKKKAGEPETRIDASLPAESEPDSEESQPCFPLFSKLPIELRLKIWKATIEPRVVFMLPRIRTSVPIILQVCKESRAEGLPDYHILTYPSVNHEVPGIEGRNNIDTWSRIYFNNKVDTLFYGSIPWGSRDYDWNTPFNELPTTVLQVHHLALSRLAWIRLRSLTTPPGHLRDIYDQALRNNSLKTITIVREEFWEAIAIHRNPEILSGTNVRLVPVQDGSLLGEVWEAWVDDIQLLDEETILPELKIANLERYATSRFDLHRINTGKSRQATLITSKNKALVSLLYYAHYGYFSKSLRYLTIRSKLP